MPIYTPLTISYKVFHLTEHTVHAKNLRHNFVAVCEDSTYQLCVPNIGLPFLTRGII